MRPPAAPQTPGQPALRTPGGGAFAAPRESLPPAASAPSRVPESALEPARVADSEPLAPQPAPQLVATQPAAPQPAAPEPAATIKADGSGVSTRILPTDFVLQVGAFRERARAVRAAQELGREGVVVVRTRRGEEEWFVVLLGVYPSADEARDAGEAYEAAVPGGSFWVRPGSDLRAASAKP